MVKTKRLFYLIFTTLICLVWLVNGLFCKLLDLVPRHRTIVSEILGEEYASVLTLAIGTGEIMIVAWIVSGIKSRHCALFQMTMVGVMNVMEFITVPHLLLFGKFNIVFASLFILLIYLTEFVLRPKQKLAVTSS